MVSVIIPVYNVEKYLAMCIESVLNQTYKDYELILVDDGSTDDSPKICDEYAEKDNRIRVFHQKNGGTSKAKNYGISVSKGEFIYFMDSDDTIHPRLLEILTDVAVWKNAAIVQIAGRYVENDFSSYAEDVIGDDWRDKAVEFDAVRGIYNLDRDDKNIAEDIRLYTLVVWTKLYRKNAFSNFGFPEDLRVHEDQMMAHRHIFEAGGMVFMNIPLYYYRMNEESLIRTGWSEKRLAILDCYEDRLETAVKTGDKGLIDYIYQRYLVSMFRNYDMVDKNLTDSARRKEAKKNILARMRRVLDKKNGNISFVKRVFFNTFSVIPAPFIEIFRLRNALKH